MSVYMYLYVVKGNKEYLPEATAQSFLDELSDSNIQADFYLADRNIDLTEWDTILPESCLIERRKSFGLKKIMTLKGKKRGSIDDFVSEVVDLIDKFDTKEVYLGFTSPDGKKPSEKVEVFSKMHDRRFFYFSLMTALNKKI